MREFVVIARLIVGDLGWVPMNKSGMIKPYPAGMITAENAALIEGNRPAFEASAAKLTPPDVK